MMLIEETAPAAEALPVAALREHLRLGTGFEIADDTAEDMALAGFLRAAIATIEARTGKVLLTRRFTMQLDDWRDRLGQTLPLAPVTQVEKVEIDDGMDAADYAEQMDACADGLFQFVMAELAPDGDTDAEEYVRRMDGALEQLRVVREAIARRAGLPAYGDLDAREAIHAGDAADLDYGPEFTIRFGKRALRVPSHPDTCSYVRITDEGREVAYWDSAEWQEDPEGVMGAIVGALRS